LTIIGHGLGVVVECKAGMLVVAGSILDQVKIFLVLNWSDWKPFSTCYYHSKEFELARCAQI